jgi:hypothetical protein
MRAANRRLHSLLPALLALALLIACGGREGVTTQVAQIEATTAALNARPSPTPLPALSTPTPRPTPTPVPFDALTLTASGREATEPVLLPAGPTEFVVRFDGDEPLRLLISTVEGDWRDFLVDSVALRNATRVLQLPREDRYFFEALRADGAWDIAISRPDVAAGPVYEYPFSAEGEGPSAVGFLRSELGIFRMHVTHDGDGFFQVTALNMETGSRQRIVTASGPFDGVVAFRGTGGISHYLFDLHADGHWTLSVDRG